MIYELRIYQAAPGKLDALLARFRDHTSALFKKHGITQVGYWLNDVGGRSDELVYILAFDDAAHRDRAFAAFLADPDWQRAKAQSEVDGLLTSVITNRFLKPTDFSPLK